MPLSAWHSNGKYGVAAAEEVLMKNGVIAFAPIINIMSNL